MSLRSNRPVWITHSFVDTYNYTGIGLSRVILETMERLSKIDSAASFTVVQSSPHTNATVTYQWRTKEEI